MYGHRSPSRAANLAVRSIPRDELPHFPTVFRKDEPIRQKTHAVFIVQNNQTKFSCGIDGVGGARVYSELQDRAAEET